MLAGLEQLDLADLSRSNDLAGEIMNRIARERVAHASDQALGRCDVSKVARLARIKITPEEAKGLETELSGILEWVKQLDEVDTEALAERLMGEILALGIDASILLPRAKVDEVAAVLQAGDPVGARDVVRRMAPAGVRRLSRRVLMDKGLRAEADRYVRRYESLLADAAERDPEGFMTTALLTSDPGRAFLLLDAAIGDLN